MKNSINWKYIKELIDIDSIKKFEEENKIELPESLKEIVVKFNGARPRPNTFDSEYCKECVFKSLLSFNTTDKENIFEINKWIKERENNIIPFASDPAGNYVCLNKNYQVVLWKHETNSCEFVCNSFKKFIDSLY
ncbi:SMI1/KNR4 family protein [Clostridium butyricum]|uniref:SMI1/KNR4 family protein n=1 Tax=Clostridium butyricum TaxID=1492 RepID=UPI003D356096